MKTSTLILNHLLPRESVELGRLVTNIHDPLQDYCQPDLSSLPIDSIFKQRLENFNAVLQKSNGSGFSAFLTQMLSVQSSVLRGVTTNIDAAACETHQLGNCEDVLRAACQLGSVRNWLERAVRRRRSVYVICGVKILVDVQVRQTRVKTSENGASAQVPTALITAAAAGFPLPLNDTLDVGAGRSTNKNSQERGHYFASGEHVFGIQYRKVKLAKFSINAVDPDFLLKGSRWKVYLSTRGQPSEVEEGIDVESGEPIYAHDIRKPCGHFEVDEEEILFWRLISPVEENAISAPPT